jgi:predicted DNA-binding protein
MPKQPTPDRRVVSVTMRDDLYQRLRSRCAALDKPVTVFIRDAIKQALWNDMET